MHSEVNFMHQRPDRHAHQLKWQRFTVAKDTGAQRKSLASKHVENGHAGFGHIAQHICPD